MPHRATFVASVAFASISFVQPIQSSLNMRKRHSPASTRLHQLPPKKRTMTTLPLASKCDWTSIDRYVLLRILDFLEAHDRLFYSAKVELLKTLDQHCHHGSHFYASCRFVCHGFALFREPFAISTSTTSKNGKSPRSLQWYLCTASAYVEALLAMWRKSLLSPRCNNSRSPILC